MSSFITGILPLIRSPSTGFFPNPLDGASEGFVTLFGKYLPDARLARCLCNAVDIRCVIFHASYLLA
jgi:hypothetical protein